MVKNKLNTHNHFLVFFNTKPKLLTVMLKVLRQIHLQAIGMPLMTVNFYVKRSAKNYRLIKTNFVLYTYNFCCDALKIFF